MTIPSTAPNSFSIDACTSRDRSESWTGPMPIPASSRAARCSKSSPAIPATATHVATKLARHFVADEPSPALVERLDKIFRDTDGDLKEIAKGLIAAPEAWTPVQSKLKRPSEWVSGHGARDRPARRSRAVRARSGVARRADVAAALAEGLRRRRGRLDRQPWGRGSTSPTISPSASPNGSTRRRWSRPPSGRSLRPKREQAVARAESRQQALALAFMSPEFQRR